MHTFSNTRSRADLLAPIYIPDVLPSDISASRGDFSFAAGSFEEVYGKENGSLLLLSFPKCRYIYIRETEMAGTGGRVAEAWDAVVTVRIL